MVILKLRLPGKLEFMSQSKNSRKINKKDWIIILLFVLAFYILLPQFKAFHTSFNSIVHAKSEDLLLAIAATLLTYQCAAATYYILVPKKISYSKTVLIQFTSMFTNRLLPLGIGSIGINYLYLKKLKIKSVQVASIIAANNIVGLVGHVLLLLLLYLIYQQAHIDISQWHGLTNNTNKLILVGICFGFMLFMVVFLRKYMRKFVRGAESSIHYLVAYRNHPLKITLALVTSIALTLSNILCLYFCCRAVNLTFNLFDMILIFSLGVFLGTATPTPGGLGGIEAGLFAGLIAFHVTSDQALAAILSFRLISFWLTFFLGSFAFIAAEKFGYI